MGKIMSLYIKSSSHPGLCVALNGAGKRKTTTALRVEFHRRRSAGFDSNQSKARGFH